MADTDRKGSERFSEDRGEVKNKAGDPLARNVGGAASGDQDNEGEGNKSADRHYREGVAHTVQSGQVEKNAKAAEKALNGAEGPALRRAEEEGKKHSHGEDPALAKKH